MIHLLFIVGNDCYGEKGEWLVHSSNLSDTQPMKKVKPKGRGCGGWLIWLLKTTTFSLVILIGTAFFATRNTSTPTVTQTPVSSATQVVAAAAVSTAVPTLAQVTNGPVTLDTGALKWTIERVEARAWAGTWAPLQGKTYLTLFGTVSNPYANTVSLLYTQVFAKIDGTDYRPKTDVMAKMRLDLGGMDYIGPEALRLTSGESRAVFVTFEVPATWTELAIKLNEQLVSLTPNAAMAVAQVAPTQTVTPAPLPTQTPAPAVFDGAVYASKVSGSLASGASTRDVKNVQVTDDRASGGKRIVLVAYNTKETAPEAQVVEIAELYKAVGAAIDASTLDVDSVNLLMGVNNKTSLLMEAKAADVVAMSKTSMSQADFLGSLTVTDLSASSTDLVAAVPTVAQVVITAPVQAVVLSEEEALKQLPAVTLVGRIERRNGDYFAIVKTAPNFNKESFAQLLLIQAGKVDIIINRFAVKIDDDSSDPLWWIYEGDVWISSVNPPAWADFATFGSTIVPTPTAAPASSNVVTAASATYYAGPGGANVRPCTKTTGCDAIIKLAAGTSILIDGTVNGDAVNDGNAIWYRMQYNGKEAYVYSGVVSAQAPAPVTTGSQSGGTTPQSVPPAAVQQWTCGTNIYNCSDFEDNIAGLDSYFAACPGDPSDLDGNPSNGIPCESLR